MFLCKKQHVLLLLLLKTLEISAQLSYQAKKKSVRYQGIMNRFEETLPPIDLEILLMDILPRMKSEFNCLAIFMDSYHDTLFQSLFYQKFNFIPNFKILVKDSEDLLSPNFKTLSVIERIRKEGCSTYILLISNAIQVARFLRFGDRYRVIDTRAKFLLLHDWRLFHADYHYLWKKIVNVIFIRRYVNSDRYELSTVPFPVPIRGALVPRRIDTWRRGKFQTNLDLFHDKTSDLQGQTLSVVTFEHVPSVVKSSIPSQNETDDEQGESVAYGGLEIEVLQTLASAMNFRPNLYESVNSASEQWGRVQLNGSFSGLLGEICSGRAEIALGNLYYTPYHLQILDLSTPYTTQCLTFLTPESLSDNSWKTLILPFHKSMWIAVLIVLLLGGFLFYSLANFHRYLEKKDYSKSGASKIEMKVSKENTAINYIKKKTSSFLYLLRRLCVDKKKIDMEMRLHEGTKNIYFNYYKSPQKLTKVKIEKKKKVTISEDSDSIKSQGLYLFESLQNSILYTFGMLILVSLPKIPTGWALRILSGWWWIYCLLVAVSYRASLTAILANPVPRVTIDTLEQLAEDNSVLCGGWGEQNRNFFLSSLDAAGQKIGRKFEDVPNAQEAVDRIMQGRFAYYENIYFLQFLSQNRKVSGHKSNSTNDHQENNSEKLLHIMKDCSINMPISIGLQKNSPLKPRVDRFLRRVIEGGLVKKWLNDVMLVILTEEASLDSEEVKALMNLKKLYGAIVALFGGYVISILALLVELCVWYCFVQRDPNYDKYARDLYYKKAALRQ
nr:PREDICTED: uncharacterized protein LOC109033142 [Bemisia tabaci]